MKYKELVKKLTLEEKASLMSGKDFWQTQNIDRLGIKGMFLVVFKLTVFLLVLNILL